MGCIKTVSGLLIDPFVPNLDCILWTDIVHAQSNLCRYTGHVREFFSVGLHTIVVEELVRRMGGTPQERRWALLHDGSEAYFNDIASPVKRELPDYKQAEKNFQKVLAHKYGLPAEMPEIVHKADWTSLLIEARDLFATSHPGEYGETEWPPITLREILLEIFYPGMKIPDTCDPVAMLVPKMVRAKLSSLYCQSFAPSIV